LEPNGEQLLAEISKHITDDMLEEIALADYGEGQEQHLAPLRKLRETGTFVKPMYWYPCEVLELISYSEPEDPSWKPGSVGIRGHWMRAFACTALLRALGPPWEYNSEAGPSCTLIKLIYSLRALPVDLTSETVRMLAWYMLHLDLEGPDKKVIYCGVGLLWLVVHRNPPPPDRDLVNLSEWIVRRESELAKQLPGGFDRWLLRIRGNNPPPSPWETLGLEFLSLDLRSHQKQLQEWVKLIGSELAGDSAS
jgi:hypothetical protein